MSEMIEKQAEYFSSQTTGLSFPDELKRIMRENDNQELQNVTMINEFIEPPMDDVLKDMGVSCNSHMLAAHWASEQLGAHFGH
eukprot:UN04801